MAHRTLKLGYSQLVERLNRFPQGVAPSKLLDKILQILFSEKEADLVSLLPIKPFTTKKASKIWKMDLAKAQKVLDELCSRLILVDIRQNEKTKYCLPPPMAGFFEFSMMRIRYDIDQKALGELFYQYMNVEAEEGLELLQSAYEHNLVQFGENVRDHVNFICNCCGCCCEAMIAAKRFGILNPIHTTNFMPRIKKEECTGCGKCVDACPVEAMTLISANDPNHVKKKIAKVNEEICLGCGVCVKACPEDNIELFSRPERVITPINSVHRAVVMAIERGKLQNLIFDNRVLWSHRALAAVLGVILKLPPIKQAMASKQMKSRYLEKLISRTHL